MQQRWRFLVKIKIIVGVIGFVNSGWEKFQKKSLEKV